MPAPDSNSEKKASSHAETNLPVYRLWSGVPRSDLRQAAFNAERLEQGQRPETGAAVSSPRSILRSVRAQACAHVYGRRANCFGAWRVIAAVVPSFFVRTQESAFNEMAEDTAAANRASNGVGTDSRRIRLVQLLGLHHEAAVG